VNYTGRDVHLFNPIRNAHVVTKKSAYATMYYNRHRLIRMVYNMVNVHPEIDSDRIASYKIQSKNNVFASIIFAFFSLLAGSKSTINHII
jgi:hypothetical protein